MAAIEIERAESGVPGERFGDLLDVIEDFVGEGQTRVLPLQAGEIILSTSVDDAKIHDIEIIPVPKRRDFCEAHRPVHESTALVFHRLESGEIVGRRGRLVSSATSNRRHIDDLHELDPTDEEQLTILRSILRRHIEVGRASEE